MGVEQFYFTKRFNVGLAAVLLSQLVNGANIGVVELEAAAFTSRMKRARTSSLFCSRSSRARTRATRMPCDETA